MNLPDWSLKALHWLELISALAGFFLLALGVVSIIIDRPIWATDITSFFHAASSFFLMAVVLFLFLHFGQLKKN